ncbi:MAG: CARDB domain-containing protein [Thermoplasmata archaeon]
MKNVYLSASIVVGMCITVLFFGATNANAIGNADLIITENSITFSSENVSTGAPVDISAIVGNNGTDTAIGVIVNFFDKNETGVEALIRLVPVFDLTGGNSTTVSAQWIPMTAGSHTITVRAAPHLTETNTTNNEANKTVYVKSGNLNVTASTYPDNPFPSTLFWVNGTVKYQYYNGTLFGPVSNAAVTIEIVDGNVTCNTTTDADGNYNKQITAPPSLGQYTINITAIKGENYRGNTTTSVLVQAPDLTAKEIMFSNEKPIAGDVVKINATISNVGNMNTTNVTVKFYVDDKELAVGTVISSLPANSSVVVGTEWTAEAGEHKIKVVVDPDNTTAEANNGNNEKEKTITVERKSGFGIPGFEIIAMISAIVVIGAVYRIRKG